MENFRHCKEWQNELIGTTSRYHIHTGRYHMYVRLIVHVHTHWYTTGTCSTCSQVWHAYTCRYIYKVRTGTRFNKSGDRNNRSMGKSKNRTTDTRDSTPAPPSACGNVVHVCTFYRVDYWPGCWYSVQRYT